MIYDGFEQRSADWLRMRTGCGTASRGIDMLAKPARVKAKEMGKELKGRTNYRRELAIERLTGDAYDHYASEYMKTHCVENEPMARAEYTYVTGREIKTIGLAMHDRIKWFCASPDGLIGDRGLIEIKCLKPHNHMEIVEYGQIPEKYQYQMDCQLMCTGRQWCDFVSYCPLKNLPEHLQLHVIRYIPDPAVLRGYELEIEQFLKEVAETTKKLADGATCWVEQEAR